MAYRFPLAPVLRMREIAAEAAEQALARTLADCSALRRNLARIDAEIARTATVREYALAGQMRAAHLHSSYSCIEELRAVRAQMEAQLVRLEAERAVQTDACAAAFRARELLCGLRNRQRTAWQTRSDRAEQQQADDAFLRRFHHLAGFAGHHPANDAQLPGSREHLSCLLPF